MLGSSNGGFVSVPMIDGSTGSMFTSGPTLAASSRMEPVSMIDGSTSFVSRPKPYISNHIPKQKFDVNLLGSNDLPSGWQHRWAEDEKKSWLNGNKSEAEIDIDALLAEGKRKERWAWLDKISRNKQPLPFGKAEATIPFEPIKVDPPKSKINFEALLAKTKRPEIKIDPIPMERIMELSGPKDFNPDEFADTFGALRSGESVTIGTGRQVDRYGNEFFRGTKKIFKETGFADHSFGVSGFHYDFGKPKKKKGIIGAIGQLFGAED